MITGLLKEPVFGFAIYLVADANAKEALEYSRNKFKGADFSNCFKGIAEVVHVTENDTDNESFILWLPELNCYHLLHECIHITARMCEYNDVPFCVDNEETVAYYTEYWYKRVFSYIENKRKKLKQKNGDKTSNNN